MATITLEVTEIAEPENQAGQLSTSTDIVVKFDKLTVTIPWTSSLHRSPTPNTNPPTVNLQCHLNGGIVFKTTKEDAASYSVGDVFTLSPVTSS
jgi:hypothetical protein